MKKNILYSEANYAAIVRDNGYFVDKTEYIAKLEPVRNPVFLRPRRFGKSLFCSLLRYYYDRQYADQFDELFGHTWLGKNPTGQQNQYLVLLFNFSRIDLGKSVQEIEDSFKTQCNTIIQDLLNLYKKELSISDVPLPNITIDGSVATNLSILTGYIQTWRLPPLYVIIDEYDNFANQLITSYQDILYSKLTEDGSLLKTFFKVLKAGREIGAIANIFITGVLPIMIDELASAFNIATILSLSSNFEGMIGFTQTEVDRLLDEVYADYEIDLTTRPEVNAIIKNHYNGYHFSETDGDALYNSTILMYFLNHLTVYKKIPDRLTDLNLRTDLSWVRRLTSANPGDTEAFVQQLTTENQIPYSKMYLATQFNVSEFFRPHIYPISFFYLGMLTMQDHFYLRLPNLNMRQIFVEYFNELHNIDTATRYSEMMQHFINHPDLEELFTGYWREYVSQLPEAVFSKMNENFYRTTFYELCNRYLSSWFTWNVERSYPSGKSDLEFVGKHHSQFAGLRWVIEFKYYSNSKIQKDGIKIETFKLKSTDTKQIAGYVTGLNQEYPEARISQYVIYCFGNQGFRIFEV